MNKPEELEKSAIDDLLTGARAQYEELVERCQSLDRHIAAEVPGWAQDDRFVPKVIELCFDIALLMLGADRQYTESEVLAVNSLFGTNSRPDELRQIAIGMREPRPGPARFFSHLDRFFEGLSVAERLPEQDLVEPACRYFLNLAQVIALIDNQYHPDEHAFHQQLTERLRTPAALPPGTSLMLRLDDDRRQPWPQA